jgi:hypothetical protein
MREVALGDAGKVLLVREHNEFKAIGNKCSHYGAPLKDGVRTTLPDPDRSRARLPLRVSARARA